MPDVSHSVERPSILLPAREVAAPDPSAQAALERWRDEGGHSQHPDAATAPSPPLKQPTSVHLVAPLPVEGV